MPPSRRSSSASREPSLAAAGCVRKPGTAGLAPPTRSKNANHRANFSSAPSNGGARMASGVHTFGVEVHVKRSVQSAGMWIVAAMVVGTATPAAAQTMATRNMDASIGYQMLHIPDETYPLGFNVDVSGAMNDRWRLVGELGWAKDEQNEPNVTGDLNFFHFRS